MIKIDLYTKYYLGELETTLIEKNSSNQILFEVILYDYCTLPFVRYIQK